MNAVSDIRYFFRQDLPAFAYLASASQAGFFTFQADRAKVNLKGDDGRMKVAKPNPALREKHSNSHRVSGSRNLI